MKVAATAWEKHYFEIERVTPLADNRIGVWRLHAVPQKYLNRLGTTVVVAAVMALLVPCVRAQETTWTRQDALHEASSEAAQC